MAGAKSRSHASDLDRSQKLSHESRQAVLSTGTMTT